MLSLPVTSALLPGVSADLQCRRQCSLGSGPLHASKATRSASASEDRFARVYRGCCAAMAVFALGAAVALLHISAPDLRWDSTRTVVLHFAENWPHFYPLLKACQILNWHGLNRCESTTGQVQQWLQLAAARRPAGKTHDQSNKLSCNTLLPRANYRLQRKR